jgi:tetratricopeptide (TPR) repeat protein
MSVAQKGVAPAGRNLVGRQELWLALVFVVALGLRGLHVWGQARNNPFFYAPTMDEEVHHQWAQQIASGAGLGPHPFFRAPLYYYLLAGLYALFGPSLVLARVAGGVLGAATCYLIARLGRALAGWQAGLLAGLIAAVYWPFIHFDTLLLTVGLEVFLNVLMLLLLLRAAERNSWLLFLLSGVVLGLSVLTRPTILALAPVIVVWLWAKSKKGAVLRNAALAFAGVALAILPVTIRNRVVGGEWVMIASYGGVNFYIGNNPQADGVAAIVPGTRADWQGGYEDTHRIPERELGRQLSEGEVSSYWFHKGLEWIRANPSAWLRLTLQKLRLFWSPVEIPNNQPDWFFASLSGVAVLFWIGFPVVACLGLASLGLLARDWRTWSLVLLYGLVVMATVVAFFCPGRYRLPFIPVLILLAAAGLVRLPGLWRTRRLGPLTAYAACGGLAAVFLASNPPNRAIHWRETEGRGHYDLAMYYTRGSLEQPALREKVLAHLREAVRLRPKDPYARTSLGTWLLKYGQRDEAGQVLAQAVELNPQDAEAQGYYADYLYAAGRLAEAAEHYQRATELNATWANPHTSLGFVLAKLGRLEKARAQLETSLRLKPDQSEARQQLGLLLSQQGQYVAAGEQFEEILKREPGNASALFNLATAWASSGRFAEAAARYQDVLTQEPGNAPAAQGLAFALQKSGQVAEAIDVLRAALQRAPDDERLLRGLAWLLATAADPQLRDGTQAVALAEHAMQVTSQPSVGLRSALAASLAEAGQFERAVTVAEQALEQARAVGQTAEQVQQLEARLALYQQRKPYHEGD